ncbi:fibronectin type III domain-containing protein [Alcanivorax sp. JB21]|uniref:fibronectin type III domain-containing protein n=1 Tax=Alcanivorax limicola TaxID=2874102 RepID=UPI001CBCB1ED|nr:fibronectin type III domain-containing protein [Alcanivorax limicola]MBZ2188064.1 fibronectin type III domain-containing protein [Alcanivorax limicola]
MNTTPVRIFPAIIFITAAIAFLVGCGGSSSSGNSSPVAVPQNLEANAMNGKAELTWQPVEDATSYTLYYSTQASIDINNPGGTGDWDMVTDATSPHTAAGLENGTPYYFVVTATVDARESAASNEVDVTPLEGVAGYTIVEQTVSIAAQDEARENTWCPEDQIAVGGGIQLGSGETDTAALQIRHQRSSTSGSGLSGWSSGMQNHNTTQAVTARQHVICADAPAGYARSGPFRGQYPAVGEHRAYTTLCPEDLVMLVGGDGPGLDDHGVFLTIFSQPGEQNGTWETALLHEGGPTENTLTWREAQCSSPLRGLSTRTSYQIRPDQRIAAGSYGERSMSCAEGQRVLHGGPWAPSADTAHLGDIRLQQSYPDSNAQGQDVWRIRIYNDGSEPIPMGIFAICVDSDD